MNKEMRMRRALVFSAVLHFAALIAWTFCADAPTVIQPKERILQVDLLDVVPQVVSGQGVDAIRNVGGQENAGFSQQAAGSMGSSLPDVLSQKKDPKGVGEPAIPDGGVKRAETGDGYGNGEARAGQSAGEGGAVSSSKPAFGTMGVANAEAIYKIEPAYPKREERNGIGGVVHIRASIAADGSLASCEISQSSGSAALDQSALAAARQYQFIPARDLATGEAIVSFIVLPFEFRPTAADEDELW